MSDETIRERIEYPKSRNPFVATIETRRDRDLPESPRKVGMPWALSLDEALPKPMAARYRVGVFGQPLPDWNYHKQDMLSDSVVVVRSG
jgi:hypothetical protein